MISTRPPALTTYKLIKRLETDIGRRGLLVLRPLKPEMIRGTRQFRQIMLGGDHSKLAAWPFYRSSHLSAHYRKLYDYYFVRKRRAAGAYNELLVSQGTCLLCGIQMVSTIDHFLPKSEFPVLSVVAPNLIPCCRECNALKDQEFGDFVHPYFDDVNKDVWLKVSLVDANPLTVRFSCDPPSHWSPDLQRRAQDHFKHLGLARLYGLSASSELSGNHLYWKEIFAAGGSEAIKAHFQDLVDSWEASSLNHWKTALLRCLRDDQRVHHHSFV